MLTYRREQQNHADQTKAAVCDESFTCLKGGACVVFPSAPCVTYGLSPNRATSFVLKKVLETVLFLDCF